VTHTAAWLLVLAAAVAGALAATPPEAPPAGNPTAAAALTQAKTRAAVRDVAGVVETIRQLKFKSRVPVDAIDDAHARVYATGRLFRFTTREQIAAETRAYTQLGLLPEGSDLLGEYLDVLKEQAGGFYDPTSKSFYLLQDMPPALLPMLAAHELTHALEDQYYDFDARLREAGDDDDRMFAVSAVHEGSATLVMALYAARQMRSGALNGEEFLDLADSEAGQAEKLSAMAPVLRRPLLGSYLLGSDFLRRGPAPAPGSSGLPVEAIDRCYHDGPRSSEQILHPEKYWDPQRRDDPRPVSLDGAGALLGPGWTRAAGGVLGELILGVLVGVPTPSGRMDEPAGGTDDWTNAAAAGWGGDRWELWRRGSESVTLLATVWDSDADAAEFAAALPPRRDGFAWERRADRVAIVAGAAGDRGGALLDRLLQARTEPAVTEPAGQEGIPDSKKGGDDKAIAPPR
jgi:hypothetical protein